uniref:Uncharacterized protein n=1 Tax=Aegilops tauschii subsp. strangulata TaxID=200361 RepID=A0A453A7M2_AEGTS
PNPARTLQVKRRKRPPLHPDSNPSMAGGGGASPAREGGREEWLRVYDRMVAVLRKSHRDVEALLADRTRLEAVLKIQHDFWLHRDAVLRDRLD